MLNFVRGEKVDILVNLDRPSGSYFPGDPLQAEVQVFANKEIGVESGVIRLVCEVEYKYRHLSSQRNREAESWGKEERVVTEQTIFSNEAVPTGETTTFHFQSQIPSDAIPSFEDSPILHVRWFVHVKLDRKMLSDFNTRAPVTVQNRAPLPQPPQRYGVSNEPEEAQVTLSLPGKEFGPGQTIRGELHVMPEKNFDASEVRVELSRLDTVTRQRGNSHQQAYPQKVAQHVKFTAHEPQSFPFTLTLPAGVPVSCKTELFSVEWEVKGVLARRLRKDTQAVEPITIFSTAAP